MDTRLEQILLTLGDQYAPQLSMAWKLAGSGARQLPVWARQLADFNILIIMGDFPYSLQAVGSNVNNYIQTWVNGYGQLYQLLSRALFPSYTYLSAHYTDDKWPVVIYMQGAATPVIQRLAGYVAPFIVQRQLEKIVSEAELVGLMDLMLDELDAGSLGRDTYKQVRAEGVEILKQLLAVQIRQLPLTEFDRQIFTDSQRIIPLRGELPMEPRALPEEDSQITHMDVSSLPPENLAYDSPRRADTQSMDATESMNMPPDVPEGAPAKKENGSDARKSFGASITLFSGRNTKRRPPVPPLPRDKDS